MTTALTGWKKLRTPSDLPEPDLASAAKARKVAEQCLVAEHRKRVSTQVVADRMRQLRENNHFADLIAETMRKTP